MSLNQYPPLVLPTLKRDVFLPDVIDFNIANNPTQPFYVFVDPVKGHQIVTHLEFGRAAHRIAHVLRPRRVGREGEVVAILAHIDTIVYSTVIMGAIVAGLVPFPISARNTPGVVAELLIKTSCHRLLATSTALKPLIDETKALLSTFSYDVQIEEIPSLAVVYPQLAHETPDHPFRSYPAPSQRPNVMDVCMIIHSSGSTGIPKPIRQTHLYWMQFASLSDLRGYVPRLILGCMALPPFHAFGIAYQLIHPAYNILACAVFPPMSAHSGGSPVVPSPDSVLKHAKATKANAMLTIPALIQSWSNSSDAIEYLKSLEFLSYAGGPLSPKLGNKLAASGVKLYPSYGGTEFGGPTHVLRNKDEMMEWEYMRFDPYMKVRWVPRGDDTYECQVLASETFRPIVNNLPDIEGFATADLFKPHPTKEGLWKIVGRLDDVIIHSSGEKTVPGPMEAIITSNPRIQGAIIFGRERMQTGVLIELDPRVGIDFNNEVQLALARNELWPTIEEANNVAPAFSRLFKEMLLFASKEKPLPRTGKGTVMRKAALDLYAFEISALYDNIEANISGKIHPKSWDIVDVESWILGQAIELTSKENISIDANLFDQGFDSLSATILRLHITHALRLSGNPSLMKLSQSLDQNLVYNMPTIQKLASYIISASRMEQTTWQLTGIDMIEEMIVRYGANLGPLPLESPHPPLTQTSGLVVLLTGSTGHIGSQILANLLKEDQITRIYAFNRVGQKSKSLIDRHVERFTDIGIDSGLLESKKLILVTGDATRADLGIAEALYHEISSLVNVVIHNAWKIDFNLPLSSYESNIMSSRHFIDLVRAAPNASHKQFLFISSVASAQSWNNLRGPVIEDVVEVSSALGSGYGEAKYICERILAKSGLQATSLRLGQICGGSPKGSWPTSEWFPILVKSSVALGMLPSLDGVATWLPANSVAQAILEIALYPLSNSFPPVLNVVHTNPVKQSVIMNGVVRAVKDVLGVQLRTVPFDEWLSSIEMLANKATPDDLTRFPAIKLVRFFRQNAAQQMSGEFSTTTTQNITTTLHPNHLKQIDYADIKTWVEYWNRVGHFN